jgi:hypothetical protein
MIMSQLLKLLLLCSLFYESATIPSQQETTSSESKNMTFYIDDIFFDEEDDYDFMNEYLDTAGTDRIVNAIDPEEIMAILNLIDAPAILELPFFLETNILNKRSLLDQPLFEPDRATFPQKSVCGVSVFLRKTDRSNFTKNSTKLSSYLSLVEETLISRLQNSVGKITGLLQQNNIDVERIFNLFENMTVEERQVGIMLHGMTRWHKTTFRIMTPLYYLENNFSLTPREIDAVAEEFGEEDKEFRKAHFVCDKIGMGDTRIEIDQRILKRPSLTFRCGLQATIPTAFTWGAGFLGSSYPKPSTLPTFDLDPVFEAIENPSERNQQLVFASLSDFFLDSFDRIAADLIDNKMGNNRHLGIGVYVRTKTPLRAYMNNSFAEKITLTNRISAELFLPACEKRFYITKINEQAFNSRNFNDLSQATENLAFLEEQMIERLFLRAFTTRIRPGAIFRWSNSACYAGQQFGFNIGTDFWIQDKDAFGKIYASPQTVANLAVNKAKPPFAEQSKLFGGLVFKHKTPKNCCFVSLNGDITFSNKGLGQDWGISLNFEASF